MRSRRSTSLAGSTSLLQDMSAGRRRAVAVLATAVAATLALLWTGMPSAQAHDELMSTTPAQDATVAAAPSTVQLKFSGAVQSLGTQVLVTGPDGDTVSTGPAEIRETVVAQPVTGELPAGTYRVQWRVTSSDGHPLSGAFDFTAAGSATAEPGGAAASPAAPTETEAEMGAATEQEPADVAEAASDRPADSSMPVIWIVAGAALVVTAAGPVVRRLRGRA